MLGKAATLFPQEVARRASGDGFVDRCALPRGSRGASERPMAVARSGALLFSSPVPMKQMIPLALVLLAGCASTGVTHIKAAQPKPVDCALDIYTVEAELKRPYEPLCLIDATSGRTMFHDRTVRGALEKAKPEACKCGADAIVLVTATTTTATAENYGEGTAIIRAVRYTGPAPIPAPPPPATTPPPPATAPAPAAGTELGPCYGNGTCNQGLVCGSSLCVKLAEPPPPAPPAPPAPPSP